MATKDVISDSPIVFTDEIFKYGFENDETPLDEHTFNRLVSGILANRTAVTTETSERKVLDTSFNNLKNSVYTKSEINNISSGINTEIVGVKEDIVKLQTDVSNLEFDTIIIDGGDSISAGKETGAR